MARSPALAMLARSFAILLTLGVALAACDSSSPEPPRGTDLLGRLADRTTFEPFVEAADAAGLDAVLSGGGPYTVFAPTDLAFDYLGDDFRAVLLEPAQRDVLARVLRHHVVAGRIVPASLADGDVLTSIDGRPLAVRRIGPVLEIGGVRIATADSVAGDNGVAYPAADVMLGALSTAERIRLSPSLTTFERLADRTGALASGAGPVTFLVPYDDAFRALGTQRLNLLQTAANDPVLRRTIRAHVVPGLPALEPGATLTSLDGDPLDVRAAGDQITVGGRSVLRVEETADGRLVLLGGVMLEPLTLGERLRIEPVHQRYWQDVRERDPDLWARLNDDDEDLTLFVPSDNAFGALAGNVVVALGATENRPLARHLLRVHVAEGRFPPGSLADVQDVPTAAGYTRRVELALGTWRFDGRPYEDIDAPRSRNGWFYSLGSVALPVVDAFDTSILRGYPAHTRAVRLAGLESVFRSAGLTAFVLPDSVYETNPDLFGRPDLADILRYNATFTALPDPGPATFSTLSGATRVVTVEPCTSVGCTPYAIDDTLLVDRVGPSLDGTGFLHALREFAEPVRRRRP